MNLVFPLSCRGTLLFLTAALALGGCNQAAQIPPKEFATTPKPVPMRQTKPRLRATPRRGARIYYGVVTHRKVLALTFDDGPDPTWTPQVLTVLKKSQVPATFFMVGKMVRAHPQFAKMVKSGHFAIGNHSWSHPITPISARDEIERTDAILQQVLRVKPTLFRPPYGLMNNGLTKIALSRGQDVIIWNSLGADWDKHATAQSIAAKVLKSARPGGIALLHDGGGHRAATVAALPHIIQTLRSRGYRFVSVPELLAIGAPLQMSPATAPRPQTLQKRRAKHRAKSRPASVVKSVSATPSRPNLRRAAPTPKS